jgi:ABC-type Zn uptake system ZnuABC Zn-binding protein ZnuA
MKKIFNTIIVFTVFILSACATPAQENKSGMNVLASTTFLADIAQNVAGDRVQVESLLPFGADPHVYQPAPQDVAKIENAQLFIINGAEFEHFLEPLMESAGSQKNIVEASASITPRESTSNEHGVDPHMWLDPNLVITYVENIRAALTQLDPEGAAVYQSNADVYVVKLKELDVWIKAQAQQVPADRRLLVMNHKSLGYFAERYGFEMTGAVIPSFSSNASPSAQQMAELIDVIHEVGAPAIFLDVADNDTLANQIAQETGVKVVYDLHLGSLTDGAPAATYLDMMRHNVTRIVEALQ